MLLGPLTHPDLLEALAAAGHGSRVLIADGNYPSSTTLGPRARLVHLNLRPGMVPALPVLEALVASVPLERAVSMDWAREGPHALAAEPPIWAEFRRRLGPDLPLEPIERHAFYAEAAGADVALTIATGEEAVYANLLLTIGVRSEEFAR